MVVRCLSEVVNSSASILQCAATSQPSAVIDRCQRVTFLSWLQCDNLRVTKCDAWLLLITLLIASYQIQAPCPWRDMCLGGAIISTCFRYVCQPKVLNRVLRYFSKYSEKPSSLLKAHCLDTVWFPKILKTTQVFFSEIGISNQMLWKFYRDTFNIDMLHICLHNMINSLYSWYWLWWQQLWMFGV